MSSDVASGSVSSEPAHSPITARKRIGSNGSSMPVGRVVAGGGVSITSWMAGFGATVRGGISARVRLAGDEGLLLPEPLREHDTCDRGCRLRAEAAVLDGHGQHDRAALVGHEAHVPGLISMARTLGRAGLAVDRERLLIPALEDVGRRAV